MMSADVKRLAADKTCWIGYWLRLIWPNEQFHKDGHFDKVKMLKQLC